MTEPSEPTLPTTPETGSQSTATNKSNMRRMLGAVAGTGIVIGGALFALSGIAAADEPVLTRQALTATDEAEADAADSDYGDEDVPVEDDDVYFEEELSDADAAVFDAFDECMADAGADLAEFDEEWTDEEFEEWTDEELEALDAEIDQAFETCEPILDDLSHEFLAGEGGDDEWLIDDFSPEDEAVFERFDECMEDKGGLAFLGGDEDVQWFVLDDENADVVASEVLDGETLRSEVLGDLGDVDIAGVAVAIENDDISDEHWDNLDAAFEACDAILDELSEGF